MLLTIKCHNDNWHNNEFLTVDLEHLCITHNYIEDDEVKTAEQFDIPAGTEFDEPLIIAFELQTNDGAPYHDSLDSTVKLQSVYSVTTLDELIKLWNDKLWHPDSQWYFVQYGAKCLVSGAVDPDDLEEILKFLESSNFKPI